MTNKIVTVILQLYRCFCHVGYVKLSKVKMAVILDGNLFETKMASRVTVTWRVTDAK